MKVSIKDKQFCFFREKIFLLSFFFPFLESDYTPAYVPPQTTSPRSDEYNNDNNTKVFRDDDEWWRHQYPLDMFDRSKGYCFLCFYNCRFLFIIYGFLWLMMTSSICWHVWHITILRENDEKFEFFSFSFVLLYEGKKKPNSLLFLLLYTLWVDMFDSSRPTLPHLDRVLLQPLLLLL